MQKSRSLKEAFDSLGHKRFLSLCIEFLAFSCKYSNFISSVVYQYYSVLNRSIKAKH